jgi:hypothetical protein
MPDAQQQGRRRLVDDADHAGAEVLGGFVNSVVMK